jgi:hypothetical protein
MRNKAVIEGETQHTDRYMYRQTRGQLRKKHVVGIARLTGRTSALFTWKQLMTIFNLGANRRKKVNTFRMYRINGRLASLS